MLKGKFEELSRQLGLAFQSVAHAPVPVEIIEYFPTANSVTVRVLDSPDRAVPQSDEGEPHHYPLGYRSDVSASMAIMPGDLGLIHYTGMQIKRGYVSIVHSNGDPHANDYTPIRSGWSI